MTLSPERGVLPRVALPDAGLEPRMRIVALQPGRMQPEMDGAAQDPGQAVAVPESHGTREISLRHEWPLAAFTLGASILVGVTAGAVSGALDVPWWAFACATALVMGVAGVHLGRPSRGWRAVLNIRHSWLSREIVAVALFASGATLWLAGVFPGAGSGYAVVCLGFAALFAADRVYAVLPSGAGYRHSAGVLLTGGLFAALFSRQANLAVAVLAVKLLLYSRPSGVADLPIAVPLLRVALGILIPAVAWSDGVLIHPLVIACIVAAEGLDRCEYYLRLERRTPRRELDRALLRIVSA